MMRFRSIPLFIIIALAVFITNSLAKDDISWVQINDPAEIRKIFSDKTFMVRKSRTDFYRKDGNMISNNKSYGLDTIAIRKWTIDGDGGVCLLVFSMPDKIIDCFKVHRNPQDPEHFRITYSSDGSVFLFRPIDGPSKRLSDSLNKKAGAER
ncbi:MAG: hypothetical protein GY933_25225 [Hyphomicrobiales bacterium]|nr:hypothetical protein [Hyphomicrobiales bacterium]